MSTHIKHMRTDWFAAPNGGIPSVCARVLAVSGL
jgi:hypothetical protein